MNIKKPKNVAGKARCVAQSWLTSWGAKVRFVGDAHELEVDGTRVGLSESPQPGELDINALASNSVDRVLTELYKVSEPLGYGRPRNVRILGDTEEIRASKDDFEAVIMRLTQFVRTVNPPEQVLKDFRWIVKREAQRAHRRHYSLFSSMAMTWEDLFQIGMVLAINHYHHYMTQKWDPDVNSKFLVHGLQQGFERAAKLTAMKGRNILFCGDGVPLEEQVSAPVPGAVMDMKDGGSYVVPDAEEEVVVPAKVPAKSRQLKARATLHSKLSAMPHDDMVDALKSVVGSTFCDYYAREHAQKMLDEHAAGCEKCIKEVDE